MGKESNETSPTSVAIQITPRWSFAGFLVPPGQKVDVYIYMITEYYSRRREVVKKRGGYGSFLKILRFRFDKKFNFVE